jgi:hypothetical protein
MSILVKPHSKFTGIQRYTKGKTDYVRWYEKFKMYCRPVKNVNLKDIENKTNKQSNIFELPIIDITERHILNFRYIERCVDYDEQKLIIDPYIFGLWLGDGTSKECALTTIDLVVANIWCEYLKDMGLEVRGVNKKNRKTIIKSDESDQTITYIGSSSLKNDNGKAKQNTNPFLNELRRLGVFNAKHIPDIYLKNSKENRLKLLAGLIDTDGCLSSNTQYEIVQKNEKLANNIVELCKSLGFFTTIDPTFKRCTNSNNPEHIGTYYRIFISITFHTPTIPLQIERKRNVKPQPGNGNSKNENSNFPTFDINGNPVRKKKLTAWTLETTQILYNIVETFKLLEPDQKVPWSQIKLLDSKLQVFTNQALKTQYDCVVGKHKPSDWLKTHIDEIKKNFTFQSIDPKKFIDLEWMDKYEKVLTYLATHHKLKSLTNEYNWYHNQCKYLNSMYKIKQILLGEIHNHLKSLSAV